MSFGRTHYDDDMMMIIACIVDTATMVLNTKGLNRIIF